MFKQPSPELVEWYRRQLPEWVTSTGRVKVPRYNHNKGTYEPDPDDH